MNQSTENLNEIAEQLRQTLTAKDAAREKAMPRCRDAIRCCSQAIRAIHRQEFGPAEELLAKARDFLDEAQRVFTAYSEFSNTGFIRDAQKEYAEAEATLALICGQPVPDPDELGVAYPAYLNGLGEAVGELRRHLLDSLRRGGGEDFEQLFEVMDDIYSLLVTIDFPDALTPGLRRTTDVIRGVLEKTRGDVTLFLKQRDLEKKLDER